MALPRNLVEENKNHHAIGEMDPAVVAAWILYHATMQDLAHLQLHLAQNGVELRVGTMDLVIQE